MLSSASGIARRLDHGWVGTEHFLLALLAEPSVATEALADVGVAYDRVLDALRGPTGLLGPDVQHYSPERGLSPSPRAYKICARGGIRARVGPPLARARALATGDGL
jgi:ATP-dependent Clp protease ATP-binding subunit ClpA